MRQAELLADVAAFCSELTGKSYSVDYAPVRNISERSPVEYRCVSPGVMRKETLTRGAAPQTYQEVRICLFGEIPAGGASAVAEAQDEMELILDTMMSRANPVRFASEDGRVTGTVKAGECKPAFDSGISLADLEAHQPMLLGCVAVMFLLG